jgi:hypothetical protein
VVVVVCHCQGVGVDQHGVEEGLVSRERWFPFASVVNVALCCGGNEGQFVWADPNYSAISLVSGVGKLVEGPCELSQCNRDGRQSP